ncbi:RNA exonuclease 4 [Pogoniulus pusillus]|uniref:RNA exonuclease 4 n=1 Tax=Pogoniulus pusillus TaxID=488313 RepID=UPI0030B9543B
MAKQSPGEPQPREKGKKRRRRKKKKKGKAGHGGGEAAQKGPGLAAAPPRSPGEFSSNWKALQELLKQQRNSSNESLSACQTDTKKKHPVKAGTSHEGSAVNGKVKAKSSPKVDHGSAKEKPPLAKAEPKEVAAERILNGTKSSGKGCKENKRNGNTGEKKKENGNTVKEGKKNGQAAKEKEKRQNANTVREKEDVKHKRRKAEEAVEQPPKEPEIWFDDVDPKDIEAAIGPEAAKVARRNLGLETDQSKLSVEQVLVKEKAFEGLTQAVAMDCEMVGVGPKGEDSIVARVSIVNQFGKCIYDKYVKPTEEVTDYRTAVSGIRPQNIKSGEDFKTVQKEVANILNGRILVGHSLRNDLKVLFLDHPQKKIRDTQRYKPFKERVKSSRPSLKLLCEKLLNVRVQTSEHCSIQDAQAAMRLYTLEKKKWEAAIKNKPNNKKPKT